jgi:hypothetical protein
MSSPRHGRLYVLLQRITDKTALCKQWVPQIMRAAWAEEAEMPMNLAIEHEQFNLFSYHL